MNIEDPENTSDDDKMEETKEYVNDNNQYSELIDDLSGYSSTETNVIEMLSNILSSIQNLSQSQNVLASCLLIIESKTNNPN